MGFPPLVLLHWLSEYSCPTANSSPMDKSTPASRAWRQKESRGSFELGFQQPLTQLFALFRQCRKLFQVFQMYSCHATFFSPESFCNLRLFQNRAASIFPLRKGSSVSPYRPIASGYTALVMASPVAASFTVILQCGSWPLNF